jgi:exopolyphosphatase/guanosine-5'-triphosphate,3'-diphosphate pyrophosphatase
MSYAVVDVGTNSVKFVIGERAADGSWTSVVDRAEVTRLGEGLDESGELQEVPMARTVDAIAGMVDEARQNDVEEIAAVGTAGLGSRRIVVLSTPCARNRARGGGDLRRGGEQAAMSQ